MNAIKQLKDPYPFFRGMVAEVGFQVAKLNYTQPVRTGGATKNNLYSLIHNAISVPIFIFFII